MPNPQELPLEPTGEYFSMSVRKSQPAPPQIPGYEILEEVGHGGMGIVYKARHIALNRLVAIKMISTEGPAFSDLVRFRTEAQLLARLEHPNIVHIYDIGEHEGRPYFALEFVAGGNLKQRVSRGIPKPEQAARLVEILARAVQAAHQHHILHRDLKPQNILLAGVWDAPLDQCVPKITDFGLAKCGEESSAATRTGTVLGTPSYMAPEQAEGRVHEIGTRADVYSLGAVLYELLTGRPPFAADTMLDTILQVISDDPQPPSQLQRNIPARLEAICLKCLRKAPSDRQHSAQELADELKDYRADAARHDRQAVVAPTPWVAWLKIGAFVLFGVQVTALLSCGLTAMVWWLTTLNGDPAPAPIEPDPRLAREKQRQREDLEQARADAAKTIALTAELIEKAHQSRGDREANRQDQAALEAALPAFRKTSAVLLSDAEIRRTREFAWQRLGSFYYAVGMKDDAEKAFRQAIALTRPLVEEYPKERRYQHDLANHHEGLGFVLQFTGRLEESEKIYRVADGLASTLLAAHADRSDYRWELMVVKENLGIVLQKLGRDAEGVPFLNQALDLLEILLMEPARTAKGSRTWDLIHNRLVGYYQKTRQPQAEEQVFRRTTAMWERLSARNPNDGKIRRQLAGYYHVQGTLVKGNGRRQEAEAIYRLALVHKEKLAKDFPEVVEYQSTLAATLHNLALTLAEPKKQIEGRRLLERAIPLQRAALKVEPNNSTFRIFLRNHHWMLALTFVRAEDHREAAEHAMNLPILYPNGWLEYHRAAGLLAQCAELAAKDAKLDGEQRTAKANAYAGEAIDQLRKAIQKEFRNHKELMTNKEFQFLRDRADFVKLVAGLEAQPAPAESARIRYQFGKSMGIGLVVADELGQRYPITYSADGETANGDTNITLVQIDGQVSAFGYDVGIWNPRQALLQPPRIGQQSTWVTKQKINITQTVQIVRSNTGRLDTCLITYLLENKDTKPHQVGLRATLDTMIVENDANPFVAANTKELITAAAEFKGAEVPAFLQALQKPDLQNPGFSAHLTLKVGGGVQAPDRVMIHGVIKMFQAWELPLQDIGKDSLVTMYWNAVEIPAGGRTLIGYAYGQGAAFWKDGKTAPVP